MPNFYDDVSLIIASIMWKQHYVIYVDMDKYSRPKFIIIFSNSKLWVTVTALYNMDGYKTSSFNVPKKMLVSLTFAIGNICPIISFKDIICMKYDLTFISIIIIYILTISDILYMMTSPLCIHPYVSGHMLSNIIFSKGELRIFKYFFKSLLN